MTPHRRFAFPLVLAGFSMMSAASSAEDLSLVLRYQAESSADHPRFHLLHRAETWKPDETAIVVCDVWDLHHCLNAVRRLEQFAPRLNDVLTAARQRGVTIIHSPSDCMPAYEDHPARHRAIKTPAAPHPPHEVQAWCSVLPAEERGEWPIDQSDGGEDDDPREHAEWVTKLKSLGRNPATPWAKQSSLLDIDPEQDFISDRGDEVWNILEAHNIRNVILTGVHTNMCVIGRPFGLRQMARAGKNVVLMCDLTDTMYNPERWPYVNHFTGTDLIVSHIERFVCPTITSDQLIGGQPFRFQKDQRKHLVIVAAEDEYETETTLPQFALQHLGQDFRVTMLYGSHEERHLIPGWEALDEADAVLVSIRRRWLPREDMAKLRDFVAAGKPVIGIRTASHAFSVRNQSPPEHLAEWESFDADVFGGNYHGHHGNQLKSTVRVSSVRHPMLEEISRDPFPQGWSLYKTSPLKEGTTVLMTGSVPGHPEEPVAWTYQRADGGRSFYTSLGNPDDFANESFLRLLRNGIYWSLARDIPTSSGQEKQDYRDHWAVTHVPPNNKHTSPDGRKGLDEGGWYRCTVRIPSTWLSNPLQLTVASDRDDIEAWLNGHALNRTKAAEPTTFLVGASSVFADDANLLVVRVRNGLLDTAPVLRSQLESLALAGRWQARRGTNATFANMPLPAKFGTSSDVVFEPEPPLWQARPHTRRHAFTPGIEGPACDADGNVFAVNFAREGTIGRVRPNGAGEVFVALPPGSVGNGIRFDPQGKSFYVADYPQHNVLRVDLRSREVTTVAHDDRMNQPNDLAIAPDGTLYASDPNWSDSTGQLWRIDADGSTSRLATEMGTTNGIEVSPDGQRLYVNESVQRNIWVFNITSQGNLEKKRLLKQFDDHGFDGMRCDVDGNLYVTRYGKGTVVKLSAQGEVLREIDVLGARPSNLCFGGQDGRTVYVTEVEHGRLVQFRVDRPGRAWKQPSP